MKKFTYLVIATAALSMVACTGGNKAGYTITGTVEGASDGDTLPLKAHKILWLAVMSLVK